MNKTQQFHGWAHWALWAAALCAALSRPIGDPEGIRAAALDALEAGKFGEVWAPWYTLHKIVAGLLDWHEHAEAGAPPAGEAPAANGGAANGGAGEAGGAGGHGGGGGVMGDAAAHKAC